MPTTEIDPEVGEVLARRLVPDELWMMVVPLLPAPPKRPQHGGRRRTAHRSVLVALVYAVSADMGMEEVPACFGVSAQTLWRRWREWTDDGVWDRLLDAAVGRRDGWAETVARTALVRASAATHDGTGNGG